MSPALARIKRGVRSAIAACGGIDGAAATAEKSRSLAGNWNNRDLADTPVLADAFALDEAAMIAGRGTPILSALAGELGHVAIRLPDPSLGGEKLTAALVEASAEFGDVARAVCEATRDGSVDAREADTIARQIDEATAALVRLRALAVCDGSPRTAAPADRGTCPCERGAEDGERQPARGSLREVN